MKKDAFAPLLQLLSDEDEAVRGQGAALLESLTAEELLLLLQEMARKRYFRYSSAFEVAQLAWIRRAAGGPAQGDKLRR